MGFFAQGWGFAKGGVFCTEKNASSPLLLFSFFAINSEFSKFSGESTTTKFKKKFVAIREPTCNRRCSSSFVPSSRLWGPVFSTDATFGSAIRSPIF